MERWVRLFRWLWATPWPVYALTMVQANIIGAVFVYLHFVGFGSQHRYDAMLSLVWTGGDKPAADLLPILRRHTARAELASQRPTGDVGLSLSYRLLMRDPGRPVVRPAAERAAL